MTQQHDHDHRVVSTDIINSGSWSLTMMDTYADGCTNTYSQTINDGCLPRSPSDGGSGGSP